MPGKYRHVSLTSSRSIRVLHLEPSQDSEAPIQCSLKVISLDEYPKWDADYTALSYSWDAQRPSCEIACDGASLLITPNCEAAIRELRDTAETKILWIDSICIDQSHKAERNLQVALMGEIYKSATKVVAWLGESDSRVEKAIGHMVEISAIDGNENRRIAQRNLRERVRNIASSEFKAFHMNISSIIIFSPNFRGYQKVRGPNRSAIRALLVSPHVDSARGDDFLGR